MKVALVRIGNSRGIRIPKPLIEACELGNTVELHVEKNRLYITRDDTPRAGWADAFRAAGPSESDQLLLDAVAPNRFDSEEWEW